ncbi:uncharacterized protein LOC144003858 [Festucalex cinctus]
MKMSPRLVLLVLAVATVCRGQNQTVTPGDRTSGPTLASRTMETLTTPMALLQNGTSANQLDLLSNATGQTPGTQEETKTPSSKVPDPDEQKTLTPAADITAVSTISTKSVTTEAASPGVSHVWGYALLVLLILVIVILLIILYLLRRASRAYSFDLRRATPGNHAEEPAGNFEALNLDDQGHETSCDRSVSPVSNGTAPQTEEHVPQEEEHVNHSKVSDIRDSNPAITARPPEKSDSCEAAEKEPDQNDITSPDSSGLLAEKDLNEPLFIDSPEASSSSTSPSSSYID